MFSLIFALFELMFNLILIPFKLIGLFMNIIFLPIKIILSIFGIGKK
jgi:hypothetical protein